MDPRQEELRRRLTALGFDEVRFARAEPAPADGLSGWLAAGHHADMAWMRRTAAKRLDPGLVLPGTRSIIMLGVAYRGRDDVGKRSAENGGRPIWATYSLHEDYHDTIKPALAQGGRVLEELYGIGGGDYRYYVDTGPVLERGWAERAGLGFLGKNGMLISRRHGNWLLLGAILTRVELQADRPLRGPVRRSPSAPGDRSGLLCGQCTRCLDACPTRAFPHPGVVDARRCISYQTIENKGVIPRELRPGIGVRVFGCDVCLEVCPWNRFAREGRRLLLAARSDMAQLSLRELLELTPARFAAVFRRTPVKRLKLAGLLRNACVAAGNAAAGRGEDHELIAPLVRLAAQAAPSVRAHAVWAVYRIAGKPAADRLLQAVRRREAESVVLLEYEAAGRDRAAAT
ncbi:MAG: tRNA epoxyqueuosine(34) reductase QueG [Verrucomicrobia bacterium RIFCSPLOWO2_12_FULL_64_8]|nr:MAG: tRNA epoxyqueuosine(34) reductase QueG [Verrucomicrobia bacterium RIFCSPLOWO2_12_FULL_64_8]